MSEASFSPSDTVFSKSPKLLRWSCILKQQPDPAAFSDPFGFLIPCLPRQTGIYISASSFSLIARIKSRLFNTVGFSSVVISAKSFVILPDSIVEIVASSSLSANFCSSGI